MKAEQRIGPYVVEGPLGHGNMGAVFRVRRESDGASFALKVMTEGLLADEDAQRRLAVEVRALAEVEGHPYVVPVVDVGATRSGQPFVVMELVTGGTLRDAMRAGLALDRGLDLLAQVAMALEHVHRHGILHRDIKPANILIDERGDARLSDFGLARIVNTPDRLTRTGELVGTPSYMAPEQVDPSRHEQGPFTDVYMLGVVLYELLCGRQPYEGGSFLQVFAAIAEGRFESPSARRPGVPPALEALCLQALDSDPGLRPPTARAFHDALAAARVAPLRRGGAGRKAAVAAAVLLLALLAGVGGWVASQSRTGPAPATPEPTETPGPAKAGWLAAVARGDLKAALHAELAPHQRVRLAAWAGDRSAYELALLLVDDPERSALAWELWPYVGVRPKPLDLVALPTEAWARVAQGEAALSAGSLGLAAVAFEGVEGAPPRVRVAALLGRARVRLAQGKPARALTWVERALTVADSPWLRARCLVVGAPIARAAVALDRAADRARAVLAAVEQEVPGLRPALTEMQRARRELQRGDTEPLRSRISSWVEGKIVATRYGTRSFTRSELLACSRGADGAPGLLLARASELVRCAEVGNDRRGAHGADELAKVAGALRPDSPLLYRVRSIAARMRRDVAAADKASRRFEQLAPGDPLSAFERGMVGFARLEGSPDERDDATLLAFTRARGLGRTLEAAPRDLLERRFSSTAAQLERARAAAKEREHPRLESAATLTLGRLLKFQAQVHALEGKPIDALSKRIEGLLRPLLGKIDSGRLSSLELQLARALEGNRSADVTKVEDAMRAERRRMGGGLRWQQAAAVQLLAAVGAKRHTDLRAAMYLLGEAPGRALAWTRASESEAPSNVGYRNRALELGMGLAPARILARCSRPIGWYVKPLNLGDLIHRQPDAVPVALAALRSHEPADRAARLAKHRASRRGPLTSRIVAQLGESLLLLGSPDGPEAIGDRRRAVAELTTVLTASTGLGVAHLLRAIAQAGLGARSGAADDEVIYDVLCARSERPWSRAVTLACLAFAPSRSLGSAALDANALGLTQKIAFPFASSARHGELTRRFKSTRSYIGGKNLTRTGTYVVDLPDFELTRLLMFVRGTKEQRPEGLERWFQRLADRPNLAATIRAGLESKAGPVLLEAGLRATWLAWPGGRLLELRSPLIRQEQAFDAGMVGAYGRWNSEHPHVFALHFGGEGLQALANMFAEPAGFPKQVMVPFGTEELEAQTFQLGPYQYRLAKFHFRNGRYRQGLMCAERSIVVEPEPARVVERLARWMLDEQRGTFRALKSRRSLYWALGGIAQRARALTPRRLQGPAIAAECEAMLAVAGTYAADSKGRRRMLLRAAKLLRGSLGNAEDALRHLRVHAALGNATEAKRSADALAAAVKHRPALRKQIRHKIAGDPLRPERSPFFKALLKGD